MKEILKTTPSLWDYLQTATKPIALFGMGDGADKILRILDEKKIPVAAVFASDGYARRNVFHGLTVRDYSTTKAEFPQMIVLVAFGTQKPVMLEQILQMGKEQELYAPDVPVVGSTLFTKEFFAEHLNEFQQVYDLLADECSKETFSNVILFKLSGKPDYLRQVAIPREEIFNTIVPLSSREIFVDAGAYNGDTIQEFLERVDGKYHQIYGIEPSVKNFDKMVRRLESMDQSRLKLFNAGAWSHEDRLYFHQKSGRGNAHLEGEPNTPVDSIDNLLKGQPATYISYDVEGAEREALEGSRHTIATFRPKLLISAYHRSEDLFAIPLQLLDIFPDYKLYFRHNPYVPAWDTHLLAIPINTSEERRK